MSVTYTALYLKDGKASCIEMTKLKWGCLFKHCACQAAQMIWSYNIHIDCEVATAWKSTQQESCELVILNFYIMKNANFWIWLKVGHINRPGPETGNSYSEIDWPQTPNATLTVEILLNSGRQTI